MNYDKQDCLEFLLVKINCISLSEIQNRNTGHNKKKFCVNFELLVDGTWLETPKLERFKQVQGKQESVDLWPGTI